MCGNGFRQCRQHLPRELQLNPYSATFAPNSLARPGHCFLAFALRAIMLHLLRQFKPSEHEARNPYVSDPHKLGSRLPPRYFRTRPSKLHWQHAPHWMLDGNAFIRPSHSTSQSRQASHRNYGCIGLSLRSVPSLVTQSKASPTASRTITRLAVCSSPFLACLNAEVLNSDLPGRSHCVPPDPMISARPAPHQNASFEASLAFSASHGRGPIPEPARSLTKKNRRAYIRTLGSQPNLQGDDDAVADFQPRSQGLALKFDFRRKKACDHTSCNMSEECSNTRDSSRASKSELKHPRLFLGLGGGGYHRC